MDDERIRERAGKVRDAFYGESKRFDCGAMGAMLIYLGGIANRVHHGEYHRAMYFKHIVEALGKLGVDVSDVDTDARPCSEGIRSAAANAAADVDRLRDVVWGQRGWPDPLTRLMEDAYHLMHSIGTDVYRVDASTRVFHNSVSEYIFEPYDRARGKCASPSPQSDGGGHVILDSLQPIYDDCAGKVTVSEVLGGGGPCHEFRSAMEVERTLIVREVPKRVIFSPPATIAFWGDGTKTIARCAEGETFSEYVGLLVCIAKRHTRVPRHAMFEDVMAKLLKRAERQAPKAKGAGDAA